MVSHKGIDIIDRITLGFLSTVTLLAGAAYILLFSLPHATWMPVVPAWQEAPLLVISSALPSNRTAWSPPQDDRYILLSSLVSSLGSLGFNRDYLYTSLAPHWTLILISSSVYSAVSVITSLLLFYYVIWKHKPSYRFCLLPWIVQNILNFVAIGSLFIILLIFMSDRNRILQEYRERSEGTYSKVLVWSILLTLYQYIAVLLVMFHFCHEDNQDYMNRYQLEVRRSMGETTQASPASTYHPDSTYRTNSTYHRFENDALRGGGEEGGQQQVRLNRFTRDGNSDRFIMATTPLHRQNTNFPPPWAARREEEEEEEDEDSIESSSTGHEHERGGNPPRSRHTVVTFHDNPPNYAEIK